MLRQDAEAWKPRPEWAQISPCGARTYLFSIAMKSPEINARPADGKSVGRKIIFTDSQYLFRH